MRNLVIFSIATLLLTLALLSNVAAQESNINFTRYKVEQGLSDNDVNTIIQDAQGFIWVATDDGLNRFDGYNFKVYHNNPKEASSLPNDSINTLYKDSLGILWVGTSKGLARYNPSTDNFTIYRHNPNISNSLSNDKINSIYQDKFGLIWIGTSKGLNKFDLKTGNITRYYHDKNRSDTISQDAIISVYETRQGVLWVGTDVSGLNRYDRDKDSFINYQANLEREEIPKSVDLLYEDSLGNLWIGAESGGVYKYDPIKDQFVPFNILTGLDKLTDDSVYSICEDHLGMLWISTTSAGLYRYDPKTNSLANYSYNRFSTNSISSNAIWSMFIDKEGILWVGTDLGLNKANLKRQHFTTFTNNPSIKNSLSDDIVYAFCEDKLGTLWVGTSDGLNKYDPKTKGFVVYKHNPKSLTSLSNDTVYAIYEDKLGTLWIGTSDGSLSKYDPKIDGFVSYLSDPKASKKLTDIAITAISQDLTGVFWIGTFGKGVIKFDPQTDKITSYLNDPNNSNSLSHNRVFTLYSDKEGIIWIGTQGGGLNRFDPKTNTFTLYKNNPNQANSLGGDTIMTIYQDSQDRLWVGAYEAGGLNKFDPKTQSFKTYKKTDGLQNSSVIGILEDSKNNLWLGTGSGISKFNPKTEKFINYNSRDGLLEDGFNLGAYYKSRKGEMFFGSKGFNKFFPEEIIENSEISPVVITDFKVFDKPFQKATPILNSPNPNLIETIELSHTENYFSLEFALLSYSHSQKNRYSYKLEGVNEDWITFTDRRYVSYSNLDYGEYIFRVKAVSSDGVWNEAGKVVKIRLIAPPWRRWWAYSIYLLVFSSIGLITVRARNKRLKSKQELLETKLRADAAEIANQAKSTFLANMSHELRTPLNAILGFTQIILRRNQLTDQENDYLKTIMRSGEHLLSLINDVLSISKIEAGKVELHKQTFNLYNLLNDITNIFSSHTVGKGLDFVTEIDANLPKEVEGDEKKLRQVLINLLGNAVKFTNMGKVILRLSYKDSQAFFEVEDTGFGIAKDELEKLFNSFAQTSSGQQSKEGTGLGLFISQNLVRLMGGEITVVSVLGKGTKFSFDIKLPEIQTTTTPSTINKVIGLAKGQKDYRILVVDDRKENREVLNALLTSIGFTVREASNGKQAIEIWQDWQPSLIWMDIRMKIMDGYTATQKIRALENGSEKRTVIIAMTASAFEQDHEGIYAVGCDNIVTKPYLESVIFEKLTQHLGVEFEYEVSLPNRFVKNDQIINPDNIDIVASLALIPEKLLEQLKKTAVQGRLGATERTIEQIGEHNKPLMMALQKMVKAYQVENLLQLIEQASKSKTTE